MANKVNIWGHEVLTVAGLIEHLRRLPSDNPVLLFVNGSWFPTLEVQHFDDSSVHGLEDVVEIGGGWVDIDDEILDDQIARMDPEELQAFIDEDNDF